MREAGEEEQNAKYTTRLKTGSVAIRKTRRQIWICFSLVLLQELEAVSK